MNIRQGDCLEVLPSLADDSVDMVFADLPYGVTANKWDAVIPLAPLWEQLLRVGKKNCAYIFTATQPLATALINSQPKLFRYDLVWEKALGTGFLNSKRQPLRNHESILCFYRKQPIYNPQKTPGKPYKNTQGTKSANYGKMTGATTISAGDRYPRSILRVAKNEKSIHPTQKPVALLEWLIKTYSNEGDTILDPTMGSGTTGVACANTKRKFIGIEKDTTYFETATKRLSPPAQQQLFVATKGACL